MNVHVSVEGDVTTLIEEALPYDGVSAEESPRTLYWNPLVTTRSLWSLDHTLSTTRMRFARVVATSRLEVGSGEDAESVPFWTDY